ncbi:MAG: hypothetical protein V4547_18125 [Bacteroidota bacterium]
MKEWLMVYLIDVPNPDSYWDDKQMQLIKGETLSQALRNYFDVMEDKWFLNMIDTEDDFKTYDQEKLISAYGKHCQHFITDIFLRVH